MARAARQRLLRRLAVISLCAALTANEAAASDLDDTARFLAGKGASWTSELADQARTEAYTSYAQQLASGWKQFQAPNLERMRTWWHGHGPATSATVFYPFGGPDLGNALALFPDADSYVLFGLEPPGAIPELQALDDASITAGLTELKASLGTILQVNYFFTRSMEKKLGTGSFNSVSGLLLVFLAMSECEVTTAKRIAIGPGGALAEGTDDARIPGVEIRFRRKAGKVQTVRYFMVNVADASLAKSSRDFVSYLESQPRFVTMIKAASYLMHQDKETTRFEQIRALILGRSDFVVQDDSGIPLRLFARDAWKLQFHGRYDAPTPEFRKYLQRDLKVELQRNSTGKLPFSYGYAFKQGESNLMTAERIR